MRRYIRSSHSISDSVIKQAVEFAEGFKGSRIDIENHVIEIPFSSNSTEADLMSESMLGKWFKDNGFNVSFERKDVEYNTQGTWRNARGWNRESGHKAYLRNRLVGIFTW